MFDSHYRLTLSGTLMGAAEKFTFGLSLARDAGDGDASGAVQHNAAQFDDMVQDSVAFFARPASRISSYAVLKEVKLATIGADGKYTTDPFIAGVNQAGGSNPGQVVYPPQIALAVSLVTNRRGPTGKGRFYLPAPYAGIDPTTGLTFPTDVALVRDSVVQWIDALNNEPDIDVVNHGVCVASTKGYNTRVTGVRVGRALDTIRTRRASLLETYSPVGDLGPNG